MSKDLLYHFFSRKKENPLWILQSILDNGIYLTLETIDVGWDDPDSSATSKGINITQYRFCLTSLDNDKDLFEHGKIFGEIGVGFKTDLIRSIGGFPVFYLPTPIINHFGYMQEGTGNGVSLFYRLAELRTVLDAINKLPSKYQNMIKSNVVDFQNMQGALTFIGNILYLIDRKEDNPNLSRKLQYYKQREWRVIAGINPQMLRELSSDIYVISEFQGRPLSSYIEEIIVLDSFNKKEDVINILQRRGMNLPVRYIKP